MPKHKSEDYKLSSVKYYLETSNNQTDTCKIFKCTPRSLMRWVNKYKNNQKITRKNRTYVAYKVSNNHIKYIKKCLKQNSFPNMVIYGQEHMILPNSDMIKIINS